MPWEGVNRCVLMLLNVSSYYYIYVSSYCYIRVLILPYVSSYYYIRVLMLLYTCPHTLPYMCPHTTTLRVLILGVIARHKGVALNAFSLQGMYVSAHYAFVLILLYMCPHTTCVRILLYVSSYYYICVLTLLSTPFLSKAFHTGTHPSWWAARTLSLHLSPPSRRSLKLRRRYSVYSLY